MSPPVGLRKGGDGEKEGGEKEGGEKEGGEREGGEREEGGGSVEREGEVKERD